MLSILPAGFPWPPSVLVTAPSHQSDPVQGLAVAKGSEERVVLYREHCNSVIASVIKLTDTHTNSCHHYRLICRSVAPTGSSNTDHVV